MVKKEKIEEALDKALEGSKDLSIALLAAHPAVACMAIMSVITAVRAPLKEDSPLAPLLDALYADARNLGLACALAPVVPGALNVIQAAIVATKARAKK